MNVTRAGPLLDETVRLLAPLASTLQKLNLGGNKLGGKITDDVAAFTKLTELRLFDMGLEGVCSCVCSVRHKKKPIEKRIVRRTAAARDAAAARAARVEP